MFLSIKPSSESVVFEMSLSKQVFSFAGRELEVYSLSGALDPVWLLANPFARFLGYDRGNLNHAVSSNTTHGNRFPLDQLTEALGIPMPTTTKTVQRRSKFINETGLNQLISRSRLPWAEDFRLWIFNEMLPSTRSPSESFQMIMEEYPEQTIEIEEKRNGFVYVATNDNLTDRCIYNIGSTDDLAARKAQLEEASPFDFRFVFTFETSSFKLLEKHLHRIFVDQRYSSDFFVMSQNDLEDLEMLSHDFLKLNRANMLCSSYRDDEKEKDDSQNFNVLSFLQ